MKKTQICDLYIRSSNDRESYEREYVYSLRIEDYSGRIEKGAAQNRFANSKQLADYLFEKFKTGELEKSVLEFFGKKFKISYVPYEASTGENVTMNIFKRTFWSKVIERFPFKKK